MTPREPFARNYPTPAPTGGDPRLAPGVVLDVGKALEAAGYPELTGMDYVALRDLLSTFVFQAAPAEVTGE